MNRQEALITVGFEANSQPDLEEIEDALEAVFFDIKQRLYRSFDQVLLYSKFEKELSIERWMDLFANNARCIFNLPYQIIQEGASGNFSVVSLQHPSTLQIENGQSKSNNMPFDTWACNAKVISTFISKN